MTITALRLPPAGERRQVLVVKIRLIVVGRDKKDPLVLASSDYLDRVSHSFPVDVVEVKEEPARASTPIERLRRAEAERIRKIFEPGEWRIALDERGSELRSEDVAKKLRAFSMDGSRSKLAFVVGGPNGLDPDLLKESNERWSLSRLTLPHRLARLVLAEQLYRACSILRGEPYHR
jgi:23S rRNA (pseudouridine1915-N3)-methyltransferase